MDAVHETYFKHLFTQHEEAQRYRSSLPDYPKISPEDLPTVSPETALGFIEAEVKRQGLSFAPIRVPHETCRAYGRKCTINGMMCVVRVCMRALRRNNSSSYARFSFTKTKMIACSNVSFVLLVVMIPGVERVCLVMTKECLTKFLGDRTSRVLNLVIQDSKVRVRDGLGSWELFRET